MFFSLFSLFKYRYLLLVSCSPSSYTHTYHTLFFSLSLLPTTFFSPSLVHLHISLKNFTRATNRVQLLCHHFPPQHCWFDAVKLQSSFFFSFNRLSFLSEAQRLEGRREHQGAPAPQVILLGWILIKHASTCRTLTAARKTSGGIVSKNVHIKQ